MFYSEIVGNSTALELDLLAGPVAVAISAGGTVFKNYESGIIEKCEGTPNHAALLVGYGTSDLGKDYWLV